MRILLLAGLLSTSLSACGEAVKDDHFANEIRTERAEPQPAQPGTVPVRIGESGPNFAGCAAAGTTRQLDSATGEKLPVRAAPFENADQSGAIPAGALFFICSRSHDQGWLGIVYNEAGQLDPGCAVSRPVTSRRDYSGPCRSGWVSGAFVKQIAG